MADQDKTREDLVLEVATLRKQLSKKEAQVAELTSALKELQESGHQMVSLCETVGGLGYLLWDPDSGRFEISQGCAFLLGAYDRMMNPDIDLLKQAMNPEDLPLFESELESLLHGHKQESRFRLRMWTPLQSWSWFEFWAVSHTDEGGNVDSVVGWFKIIDEQVRLEEEVAIKEASIRYVFDTMIREGIDFSGLADPENYKWEAFVGVDREVSGLSFCIREGEQLLRSGKAELYFVKDKAMRYAYVKADVAKMFGMPPSDMLGHTDSELFGGQDEQKERDIGVVVFSGTEIQSQHARILEGKLVSIIETLRPYPPPEVHNECDWILACWRRDDADRKYPSPAMREVLEKAFKVSEADTTVLITGESGSGKEYLARFIHEHSHRSKGPFVGINCATITPELAESRLFGHEKGAFTGAIGRTRGVFEVANGGTLLLDEVGEIPRRVQAKLLRVLQEKSFERVGGTETIKADVRLLVATKENLEHLIAENRFREDLYYRLNVIQIRVPPLRERLEDLPILVHDIVRELTAQLRWRKPPHITSEDMDWLRGQPWPGNVRELRNVLERAMVVGVKGKLDIDEALRGHYRERGRRVSIDKDSLEAFYDSQRRWIKVIRFPEPGETLRQIIDDLSCEMSMEALRKTMGKKEQAAVLLGVTRAQLDRNLRKQRKSVSK